MKGQFKLQKTGKTIKKGKDTLVEYKRVATTSKKKPVLDQRIAIALGKPIPKAKK